MSLGPTFVQDDQGVWHKNPILVNTEHTFFIHWDDGEAEFVGIQTAFPDLRHIRDALFLVGLEQPCGKLYSHRGQRNFEIVFGSSSIYNAIYCRIEILRAPRADLFLKDEGKFYKYPDQEGYYIGDLSGPAQAEPPMC